MNPIRRKTLTISCVNFDECPHFFPIIIIVIVMKWKILHSKNNDNDDTALFKLRKCIEKWNFTSNNSSIWFLYFLALFLPKDYELLLIFLLMLTGWHFFWFGVLKMRFYAEVDCNVEYCVRKHVEIEVRCHLIDVWIGRDLKGLINWRSFSKSFKFQMITKLISNAKVPTSSKQTKNFKAFTKHKANKSSHLRAT